jgi:cytochrome b561
MPAGPIYYSKPALIIHWLSALLVVALIGVAWFMVELPKGPDRGYFFALHKSLGLSAFALLCLRIAWRIRRRPPDLPKDLPRWQRALAKIVHLGFYAVLIVQPISGYLSSGFSGYKTAWFGISLPHWGWPDAPLNELFTEIHVIGSIALVIFLALHIGGTVSHILGGRADVWRRMWHWR